MSHVTVWSIFSNRDGENQEHPEVWAPLELHASRSELPGELKVLFCSGELEKKNGGAALAVNLDGEDVRQPTGTEKKRVKRESRGPWRVRYVA